MSDLTFNVETGNSIIIEPAKVTSVTAGDQIVITEVVDSLEDNTVIVKFSGVNDIGSYAIPELSNSNYNFGNWDATSIQVYLTNFLTGG